MTQTVTLHFDAEPTLMRVVRSKPPPRRPRWERLSSVQEASR